MVNAHDIIEENFSPEDLHPSELEDLINAAYEEYNAGSIGFKLRKKYREAYNKLVDLLAQKRGFKQFSYL